jgi:CxxC motif-containing protein (DUF1111 family)
MIADPKIRGASSKVSAYKALKLLPFLMALPFATVMLLQGQSGTTDPGVRGGPANAGGRISGLSEWETIFFTEGQARFVEIDSVSGGLGPRFNMNSCAGCHAQPSIGGTSPFTNPQVGVANLDGATNTVPFFITTNGPVREARFIFNPNGTRDGGVHDLFTITGRSDAVGCSISQPDFNAAAANHNLIFRIPTPLFGGGLIEAIEDSTIIANMNSNLSAKKALGILGHPNTNGNDGTITRFGWKGQNKSLELFVGEAYNVEQGVTNEIFPNERDETPGCLFNGTPEDHTNFTSTTLQGVPSDVVGFALFIRFLAPPTPAPATGSTTAGSNLFNHIGCALCHTPTLMTGPSSSSALNNKPVNLFSDLLVHHMGQGLGDNIIQGNAEPDEFRTAPLWGLGQRIFFLHDGRTTDLLQAIEAHASTNSEANGVIANFNALSPSQRQGILNFLRSL